MISYKFNNKKERIRITLLAITTSIFALLMFSSFDFDLNKNFLYFISASASFIYVQWYIRRSKAEIEDISFDADTFKLYFFNKMRDPEKFNFNEIELEINNDEITILDKMNKPIGKAFKKNMEDTEKWEELINRFNL